MTAVSIPPRALLFAFFAADAPVWIRPESEAGSPVFPGPPVRSRTSVFACTTIRAVGVFDRGTGARFQCGMSGHRVHQPTTSSIHTDQNRSTSTRLFGFAYYFVKRVLSFLHGFSIYAISGGPF
ncbi:MAG: hypothetical protein MI741_05290 [Rhodospirillales bacterium]|nr:hypothetical protein [Rhodospirillales bacterium]